MAELKRSGENKEIKSNSSAERSKGPSSEVKSKRSSELEQGRSSKDGHKKGSSTEVNTKAPSEQKSKISATKKEMPNRNDTLENTESKKAQQGGSSDTKKPPSVERTKRSEALNKAENNSNSDSLKKQEIQKKDTNDTRAKSASQSKELATPQTKEKTKDKPLESANRKDTTDKLANSKNTERKQPLGKNLSNSKESKTDNKHLDRGDSSYSLDKAKLSSKGYDALGKSMGESAYKEAYDKAKKDNKSEAEAKAEATKAKNNAEKYIAEKKDSSAKFCDEDRFLNHANAKGERAKAEAEQAGKSPRKCEQAYNEAFRKTYIADYGKRAYDAKLKETGDKKAAEEAKNKTEYLVSQRVAGNRINRIKPGSRYYKTYEDARKNSTSLTGHGEAFNKKPLYVYSSKDKDASGNYSTEKKHASPRDTVKGNALPGENTAEKREQIALNNTKPANNKYGKQEVYGLESTSAPKLADQEMGKLAKKENDKIDVDIAKAKTEEEKKALEAQKFEVSPFYGGKEKLVGGDMQVATSGNGLRDGSARKIETKDTPENIQRKQDYLKDLSSRCKDTDALKNIDPSEQWEKVDGQELMNARDAFNRDKDKLIKDWEAKHGESWPTYKEDVYNSDGKIVRHAGDKYDAHHVQPLSLGGRNTSDNLVPLHYKDHIGNDGIHNTESYNKLFESYNAKKDND